MKIDSLLGRHTEYPKSYAPDLLCAIPRADNRRLLGIAGNAPFAGEDLWTAWDLTWLGASGKPAVAVGSFRVPASSRCLVESKSLKLYLNSLAMASFDNNESVASAIARDLSNVCEAAVDVSLTLPECAGDSLSVLPGICIDDTDVRCERSQVDPSLLAVTDGAATSESLCSHLFRSLCPVTGQPDLGSILIRYRGRPVEREALLRYLVSYREHSDFHESCVERIFIDLSRHCATEELSVYARYNRRGGLDINPFRSNTEAKAPDMRLWRQ